MIKKYVKTLAAVFAAVTATALCGCIKDDIPYPHIQANFVTIEARGESQSARIDTVNRVVTFRLPETVDICNVEIAEYTLTPGAEVRGNVFANPIDLSQSQTVNLYLYYDYEWTLTAIQQIERYMAVVGQVGESTIDVPARRVLLSVADTEDLTKLSVEKIKLGPEGSVMTPDLNGATADFTKPVEVMVSAYGRSEKWTLYADVTEALITTASVDAWTNVAWVYGQGIEGSDFGVEYRQKGHQEWIAVPDSWLTVSGGSFHARLIHLTEQTTYEARAVADENYGAVVEFTTGKAVQTPNLNFDSWWLDGKVWCPWAKNDETPYWSTGNKGATTLGNSNTVPTDDTVNGTGQAAMLQTKFVGAGAIGKLAAGNIFIGDYVRTDGTNGVLAFGRPFTERPTRLRGYFKYNTAPISSTIAAYSHMKGQPDTCIVWCALIDQPTQFEIRTNPANRQLFDPEGPTVVAYGKMEMSDNVGEYTPFDIEFEYKATNRKPKYLLITASASKYGDYFTGGNGAVMWVDEFELGYDY